MIRVLYLFFLLLPVLTLAQQKIDVRVVSLESGLAVPSVYLHLYSDNPRQLQSSNEADQEGRAVIAVTHLPAVLEVAALGYEPLLYKIPSDSVTILTLELSKRHTTLEEFVVTGVTTPIRPQNALSTYRVINSATIQSQGAVTLNEVLGNQLNMSISNDNILGSGVRMQGLSGDKVKTLWGGVALNGREGGNIDMGQVNLYNVERIEIVQGPMSIIYGSDALGGVINVIEKENRKPWEAQAVLHYESVGKYNFNVAGNRSWKKHNFAIGGGRNYFQGWKYIDALVDYNLDTIHIPRRQLFKPKEQLLANAGYQYHAASGFKVKFASDYLKEKVSNKGSVDVYNPFAVTATDEYYYTTRSMNRLALNGKLGGKGTWQILNGFMHYRRIRQSLVTDLSTLSQTTAAGNGMQDTSRFNDVSSRGMYSTNAGPYEITLGYDVLFQTAESQKIAKGRHNINDYAAFGQVSAPLLKDKLKIQGGIRAAHNSTFRAPVISAINLLFNASKNVQMRGSYAKGFRAPSLKEMYLDFNDNNHNLMGNQNLKSERGDHGQLSVSWQVHQKESNYAQLLLTGFYNNVSNGIVLFPLHPEDSTSIDYSYANIAKQQNVIGTVQFEGQQENLHFLIGYSYNHTFRQEGSYNSFHAQEFNTNLSYYLKPVKVNFSVFYKYIGPQPFLRSNIDGNATYDGSQPSYNLLDASLDRKFLKRRLQLTVGVKNILNLQTLSATGLTVGGIHSGNGSINFMPRSLFTTLRYTLD